MQIDKSDFYPGIPGQSCDPDEEGIKPDTPEIKDSLSDKKPESSPHTPHHTPHPDTESDFPIIDRISNIMSWILVPLLLPVYATMILLWFTPLDQLPLSVKWGFTSIVALISTFIPMILVIILKRFGIVEDLGLNGRKERLIPYIISICSFIAIAWFLYHKGMPLWINLFFMGGALAGFINMLVNFRWKISAHAAAASGVVALILIMDKHGIRNIDPGLLLVISVALCGLLGSARVWLGRHTSAQVICGYIVGFLSVYLIQLI